MNRVESKLHFYYGTFYIIRLKKSVYQSIYNVRTLLFEEDKI